MARKPRAAPKTKRAEKPQSERFKEAARKLGAAKNMESFEAAFKKMVPAKLPVRSS